MGGRDRALGRQAGLSFRLGSLVIAGRAANSARSLPGGERVGVRGHPSVAMESGCGGMAASLSLWDRPLTRFASLRKCSARKSTSPRTRGEVEQAAWLRFALRRGLALAVRELQGGAQLAAATVEE